MAFDLANGHGTTRLSLEQLLERERERNAPEDFTVQRRRMAPEIGILSRTLIASSMVKWIVPARLMGDNTMQLLFVGENFLHVKEVTPDSQVDFRLRHRKTIPFTTDQVRAVALIGQRSKSQLRNDTPLPNIMEAIIQSHMPSPERRTFPIQIIALALSSNLLLLLTQDTTGAQDNEDISFMSKLVPLPVAESHALSSGTQIVVDPFSRAFAVAAAFDTLVVYNNFDSRHFATRIASDSHDWCPIRQERIFSIPGYIVGVSFLNPGADKDDVVMIVVSANGKSSTLSCFSWPHQDGPHSVNVIEHQPLSLGTGTLCNMIIPMAHSPDFLLVHGATVNLYTDILTGSPRVLNVVNKKSHWETGPAYPANSKRIPHFTSWSRPERVPTHRGEFLYLFREDGAIRHFQRDPGHIAGVIGNTGDFGCHVGSATTCFCPMRAAPDYLVTTGDLSPGEMYSVGVNLKLRDSSEVLDRTQQMGLIKQATLPDWAPIMDMQIVHRDGEHKPPSILTTSGRQPFGAINELRVGLEAQISRIADLTQMDETLIGANNIWALAQPGTPFVHYICSYPNQTVTLVMSSAPNIDTSELQLEAGQSTILAFSTPEDIVVLVTESTISLQTYPAEMLSDQGDMQVDLDISRTQSEQTIISACHHGNILLIATRTSSNASSLRLFDVKPGKTEIVPSEHSLGLESEVTAMALFNRQSDVFSVVATRSQSLMLCSVISSTLRENYRVPLEGSIVQTVQVLQRIGPDNERPVHHVLCGLRDGRLASIVLHLPSSDTEMDGDVHHLQPSDPLTHDRVHYYHIGHGPVQISSYSNSAKRAFVLCDNKAVAVEVDDKQRLGLQFTSVYFTDDGNPSYRQTPLAAIAIQPIFPTTSKSEDHEALLTCHDGQNLFFARLLYERRTMPRRLPLKKHQTPLAAELLPKEISGTPTKVLYSNKLNATVVAGVKYVHKPKARVPEPGWQGKRATRGFLSIIPSTANQDLKPEQEAWNEQATQIDLAPGERVLSLCEWRFEREGRSYHYLLVGTTIQRGDIAMIDGRRQRVKRGRLWFLAPRKNEAGAIRVDLISIKDVNRPVRSLAVLDETKVIVAPEGNINVYTFSAENKWTHVCTTQLPSPAVHITTQAPRIFVTTARNSIIGYDFKQPQIPETGSATLEQIFADDMLRKGIAHVDLQLRRPDTEPQSSFPTATQSQRAKDESKANIVIGSDKDGQIFGLEVPRYRAYQSAAPTIFEMRVPQCITKFSRGAVRAPWYERPQKVSGIIEDDIFGSATDGSVIHFSLITNEARLLLKFLENLVRWDEIENQRSMLRLDRVYSEDHPQYHQYDEFEDEVDDWPVQNVVIDPEFVPAAVGVRTRRDQHGVNGDLLEGFLGKQGEARLSEMLRREVSRSRNEESRYVGNRREERVRKFVELVVRALGNGGGGEDELAGAVGRCVAWLREVMRPVL